MHCIAALAVLKQFWCRVIKRLRITLLCPWCYYILWWLSSIKIYKIGGSETLKQWLSSIRIITIKDRRFSQSTEEKDDEKVLDLSPEEDELPMDESMTQNIMNAMDVFRRTS